MLHTNKATKFLRNSKFQARKRGYLPIWLPRYDLAHYLIPRVLSYSAFLLASFLAPGDGQERTLGMRLRGRLLKGSGGRVEYSSVRERNRRARCPASRCHPVYELNTRTKISSGTNGKLVYYRISSK